MYHAPTSILPDKQGNIELGRAALREFYGGKEKENLKKYISNKFNLNNRTVHGISAEDIVQATACRALERIDEGNYIHAGKFSSWIYSLAISLGGEMYRVAEKSERRDRKMSAYDIILEQMPEHDASTAILERQMPHAFRQALTRLSQEHQRTFELRMRGLDLETIAMEEGISAVGVSHRIIRGSEKLTKILGLG